MAVYIKFHVFPTIKMPFAHSSSIVLLPQMLRSTLLLLCLAALTGSKEVQKRQVGGYGAPAAAVAAGYGAPAAPKCRTQTRFVLTWTKTVLPVTVYDTQTRQLPTTLYRYVTATETVPVTAIKLVTTSQAARPGYQEDTRISYRTRTVVVPQVEAITSTLVLTEDEHLTVTETDHVTQTQVRQYPVQVTSTSVVNVPQVRGRQTADGRRQTGDSHHSFESSAAVNRYSAMYSCIVVVANT